MSHLRISETSTWSPQIPKGTADMIVSLEPIEAVRVLAAYGNPDVILLSNTRPDPFRDMHFFLDAFKAFIGETRVVIGVTQMDLAGKPTLDDYHLQLESSGAKTPIFEVDARAKRDVALLVEALLYSLDPGLDS